MSLLHNPRWGRMVLRLLEMVSFFLGALVTMWAVHSTEVLFMPVIRDWSVDYIERTGDGGYTLGGTLKKVRACELIAVNVLAVPKQHFSPRIPVLTIRPDEIVGGQVARGFTQWGPWTARFPMALLKKLDQVDYLEVIGTHQCHAFWEQETLYGQIAIERFK